VLAGAAEANVRETLRACETYLEFGARAVAIVAPYYYKLSAESVYAYFCEIARHTPIDITLYNIPIFASAIDAATLQRLAEFPRIVGIKRLFRRHGRHATDDGGSASDAARFCFFYRAGKPRWHRC